MAGARNKNPQRRDNSLFKLQMLVFLEGEKVMTARKPWPVPYFLQNSNDCFQTKDAYGNYQQSRGCSNKSK